MSRGLSDVLHVVDTATGESDDAPHGKLDCEDQRCESRSLPARPVLAGVLGAATEKVEEPTAANLVGADPTDVEDGRVGQEVARVADLARTEGQIDVLEVDEEALVESVQFLEEPASDEVVRPMTWSTTPFPPTSSFVIRWRGIVPGNT